MIDNQKSKGNWCTIMFHIICQLGNFNEHNPNLKLFGLRKIFTVCFACNIHNFKDLITSF